MVCQFGDITNSGSLGSAKDGFSSVKTLRNLRYVKYAGLTAWLLALIFIILINVSRSYASNQSDQAGAEAGLSTLATTVTGQAKVGMSDPGDVGLSAIAEGGIVTGGHNLTVSSTSVAGYKVAMESDGALKDDSFAGSESTNNTLIMPTTGGTLTAPASLTNNSWGVAIVGNSGFDDVAVYQSTDQSVLSKAKFAPIPGRSGDNPDGQVIFSGNAATTGDTRAIYYGVKTDPYFRAGNYSTTVTYTVTAVLPDEPSILSVAPNSYELDSGASGQITINGTNLLSAYSVYITNTNGDRVGECANLNVTDDSNISCVIPTTGIPAGDYTIHVVTQGGEATVGFVYEEGVRYRSVYDTSSNVRVDFDYNMIPIKYAGNTSSPRWEVVTDAELSSNPKNWFSYDTRNKKWANAVTVTKESLSKYQSAQQGSNQHYEVDNNDILGYWVYIPRYAYEVMRRDATDNVVDVQNFDIRFETVEDAKKIPAATCSTTESHKDYRAGCKIRRTYGAATGTTWATHPAFSFGDKEVNGFWISKFWITGTKYAPTSKPNQHANVREYIGEFYSAAKSIGKYDPNNIGGGATDDDVTNRLTQNSHGLLGAKSHMLKNSEWGAVEYLANSKYGAGTNSSYERGTNVFRNGAMSYGSTDADGDSSKYGITGCGPRDLQDTGTYGSYQVTTTLNKDKIESSTACTDYDGGHAYYESLGIHASTTTNQYGVYDMGGTYDYVMGNRTDSNQISSSQNMLNPAVYPYVDLYSSVDKFGNKPSWSLPYVSEDSYNVDVCTFETCGGTGTYETVETVPHSGGIDMWGNTYMDFVDSSKQWFARGGISNGNGSGILIATNEDGAPGEYYAYHAVLMTY